MGERKVTKKERLGWGERHGRAAGGGEQGGLYWLYCVIVFRSHEWDESGVWPLDLANHRVRAQPVTSVALGNRLSLGKRKDGEL